MRTDAYDWPAIEREYVTGAATLAQVAARWHISISSVRKRSAAGGWPGKRQDHRLRHAPRPVVAPPAVEPREPDAEAPAESLTDLDARALTDRAFSRGVQLLAAAIEAGEYLPTPGQLATLLRIRGELDRAIASGAPAPGGEPGSAPRPTGRPRLLERVKASVGRGPAA